MKWRNPLKKETNEQLVVEAKDKGLAVFSYAGYGLALRIEDNDIETVFEVAKAAIKLQMEKEDDRQEKGEEVRTEEEQSGDEATEPVDRDTSTGGVSSEVHGSEESDVR